MKKGNNQETSGLMNTIIGRDTVINGTLDVKGALRVDGEVLGKINCSDCVTVGTTGNVQAEIEADSAIVAGKMSGNVTTSDRIELQANCEMNGDLHTKSLIIEEGAIFCGGCSMNDNPPDLGFLAPKTDHKKELSESDID